MILQVFYYSGNSIINLKTYFSFKPKKLRFQNENVYSGSTPRTAGWIPELGVETAAPPFPRRGARRRCVHGRYSASFAKREASE
jgi:hypothetical protein